MKNLKINKEAIGSLILAGSISLTMTGCSRKDDTKETFNVPITIIETTAEPKQDTYINKYNSIVNLNDLNNGNYTTVEENDNKYTLFKGANIYYKGEWNITDEKLNEDSMLVTVIKSSDKYSLVKLSTGEMAYVENIFLIKCPNLHDAEYMMVETNKDTILTNDCYLYDNNGMYLDYLKNGEACHMVASNGEYTLITREDGSSGYVLDMMLMNAYQQIDGYAFINKGTNLYRDKNFKELYRASDGEVIQVEHITSRYAAILDGTTQDYLYVKPSDLKSNFVVVDLNAQRMYCYTDYQIDSIWPTKTGKDSTPTHTGAYDIDAKTTDWEFTNFPGSRARYWIPIDPQTQEGIHDLVGDDEQNYGTGAYHSNGSHGCMRVPQAASKYVYDTYQIGDIVFVCESYKYGEQATIKTRK